MGFLVVGADDKAVQIDGAEAVARLFREPWNWRELSLQISALGNGDVLEVDNAVVVRLSGV